MHWKQNIKIDLVLVQQGIHTLFMNLHILVGTFYITFYAKENFLSSKNVYSLVVNVYFSDHDAVQVTFSTG